MKDFDALAPPRRLARVGGEEIDVSILSVRAALKFVSFSEKYNFNAKSKAEDFKPQMLEDMAAILAIICERSSKKITAEWLINNLDMGTFIAFMQYALKPMMERINGINSELPRSSNGEGEPEKN